MKTILFAITCLSLTTAHAASVKLFVRDSYMQNYLSRVHIAPNSKRKITIKLNADGFGEMPLRARHYQYGTSPLANEVFITQKISVQKNADSCQLKLSTALTVQYCNLKKMEAGIDCNTNENVTKEFEISCADLTQQKFNFETGYDLWEEENTYAFYNYLEVEGLSLSEQ